MSRYRKIDVRIWNDAKFCSLSRDAQFTFLFLLTHPSMTALGAFRATIPGLAAETKQLLEPFREQFQQLIAKRLVECDETVSYVGLPNFLKYNGPDNPNGVKAWAGALDLIPECQLKNVQLRRAKSCAESRGKGFVESLPEPFLELLPEPFGDGSPNQEQEQEQEQDIKNTCSEVSPTRSKPVAASLFENDQKPSSRSRTRWPEAQTSGPIELTFPTRGSSQQWHLTRTQVDAWSRDYPGMNILAVCRKARAWCEANSAKRKTAKGMPGFLVNWLNREANNPGSTSDDRRDFSSGRNGKPSLTGGPGVVYDPATKNDPTAGDW